MSRTVHMTASRLPGRAEATQPDYCYGGTPPVHHKPKLFGLQPCQISGMCRLNTALVAAQRANNGKLPSGIIIVTGQIGSNPCRYFEDARPCQPAK